jgi:hypothetical protein
MWQTARLRQYDGYLGNPDATGSSATAYTFHLIREPPPAAGPVRSESLAPASTLFLLTCALALFALLAVGTTAWSLS